MSLSSAVLNALLDSGCTRDQLAAAMRADIAEREAAEAERLAKKREGNRIRQQRKRDNDRNAESRVTAVTERDPAPNERDNLTPTREEKPSPKGEVKKIDRGSRLPADWEPAPLTGKAAEMVALWNPGELERELAKFKNYWPSKGANAARTDWQRTWVNWLISADERKPRRNERPDEEPTAAALRRIIGPDFGAHAGTG
jgi:hypothetical protein